MYEFLSPKTMEEAVDMLRSKKELRILAGGTDLIIALKDKVASCRYLMDCKRIPELQVLAMTEDGLEVGAAVSLSRMLRHDFPGEAYAAVWQSGGELANSLLRNRATLAGNICNASPGGDMLAPCLVLDTWVETVSPAGGRRIPLKDFFTGVKKHVLAADEMVVKVVIPRREGVSTYLKRKRIRGHDLAQIGVAGFYGKDGVLKLAYAAAAPTPILLDDFGTLDVAALRAQRDAIAARAAGSISPISDVRSTREYRLEMARNLTAKMLDEFAGKMEGAS